APAPLPLSVAAAAVPPARVLAAHRRHERLAADRPAVLAGRLRWRSADEEPGEKLLASRAFDLPDQVTTTSTQESRLRDARMGASPQLVAHDAERFILSPLPLLTRHTLAGVRSCAPDAAVRDRAAVHVAMQNLTHAGHAPGIHWDVLALALQLLDAGVAHALRAGDALAVEPNRD